MSKLHNDIAKESKTDRWLFIHQLKCPNCEKMVSAVSDDNHDPKIIACPHCHYSDL
jgi:hypothetical protein